MSFKSTIRRLATNAQADLANPTYDPRSIATMLARQILDQCELQDECDREDAARRMLT